MDPRLGGASKRRFDITTLHRTRSSRLKAHNCTFGLIPVSKKHVEVARIEMSGYLDTSVEAAVDGSVARIKVSPKDRPGGDAPCYLSDREPVFVGGGLRDVIRSFSRSSRRRMQTVLASVPKGGYDARQLVFVTLTYPHVFPENPAEAKSHLRAWRARIERRYGNVPAIWKMEFQARGAVHYHVLLFAPVGHGCPDDGEHWAFGQHLWFSWYGLVGGGLFALMNGVTVRSLNDVRMAMAYLSKYMAKPESYRAEDSIGRVWGVWRKDDLGIMWRSWNLEYMDYLKLRRVFRRLCKYRRGRGKNTNMLCFLSWDELGRYLEWLGVMSTAPPLLSAS